MSFSSSMSCFSISLHPSPSVVTWQQEKWSCHFVFPVLLLSSPTLLRSNSLGCFLLTRRAFHLPVCVKAFIVLNLPPAGRQTQRDLDLAHTHARTHRHPHNTDTQRHQCMHFYANKEVWTPSPSSITSINTAVNHLHTPLPAIIVVSDFLADLQSVCGRVQVGHCL